MTTSATRTDEFDGDYPQGADLRKIRQWPGASVESWLELMEFIEGLWWMPEWGWKRNGHTFWISTVGWSGNEELIDALKKSKSMLWTFAWEWSRRGGHYKFKVPSFEERAGSQDQHVGEQEESRG